MDDETSIDVVGIYYDVVTWYYLLVVPNVIQIYSNARSLIMTMCVYHVKQISRDNVCFLYVFSYSNNRKEIICFRNHEIVATHRYVQCHYQNSSWIFRTFLHANASDTTLVSRPKYVSVFVKF